MKINSEIVNKLIKLDFLKASRKTDIDIIPLRGIKEAEKSMNSQNGEIIHLRRVAI